MQSHVHTHPKEEALNNSQFSTPIVIGCEDPILHTDGHPWCSDGSCPCHSAAEGRDLRSTELWQPYQNGLATWDETLQRFYDRGEHEQAILDELASEDQARREWHFNVAMDGES